MNLYFEFFKKAFQERYIFRFDFYISILSNILVLFISVNIWEALYKHQTSVNSITLDNMLSYTLISSFVLALTRSVAGRKIAARIEDGSIVSDFTRPINLKHYMFAEDVGNNLFQALLIVVPAFLIGFFYIDVFQYTTNVTILFLFLIMLIFSTLIAFLIHYIFGLCAFWLETTWYMPFFVAAFIELFAGSVVPLWFYPYWLQSISNWLPFRFIFFEPISVFLGRYDLTQTLYLLLIQIIWFAVLWLLEKFVWIKVQKKVFTNGG